MKRIIYTPALGETIPDGAIQYTLQVSGFVIDVLEADDFVTAGTIHYDSLSNIPTLVNGSPVLIDPKILPEPFIHHFAGWEV